MKVEARDPHVDLQVYAFGVLFEKLAQCKNCGNIEVSFVIAAADAIMQAVKDASTRGGRR